jgi:deoxycitidine kinase
MNKVNPIVISIEGNIGGGKSTMLEHIKKLFPEYHIIDEPVDSWLGMIDESGKSLLEHFYTDKKRWSYTFQNCAFITRFTAMNKAIKDWQNECIKDPSQLQNNVFITERSVLTDRYVFAEMLKDSGDLTKLEWDLYRKWFDYFAIDLPIGGIIEIDTDFDVCAERIKMRNRKGEESIPIEYLESLETYCRKWLSSSDLPLLRISSEPEELNKFRSFIDSLRSMP